MRILYLTTVIPNNVKTGGEIVSRQCIESLRTAHDVFVLAYKRTGEDVKLDDDDHVVDERIIETRASKIWFIIWLILSFINKRTYSSQKYLSKKYINIVNNLFKNNDFDFDVVVVDHSQLSWVMSYIPATVPIIYISHNVEYLVYRELANHSNTVVDRFVYTRESKLMRREEKQLLQRSDHVWVLSGSDKKVYNKLFNKSDLVHVINVPGGFNQLVEPDIKYDIGILGTWTWESNRKGLDWFFQDVLPLIDSKYTIALGGKGSLVYEGVYSNVTAVGVVEDAQLFLSSCRLIVIPATAGGGIQIKTLDSISTNRPVITTSVGIRGIDDAPCSVFIKNSEKDFSNIIHELLATREEFDVGFTWTSKRRKEFSNHLNECVAMSH